MHSPGPSKFNTIWVINKLYYIEKKKFGLVNTFLIFKENKTEWQMSIWDLEMNILAIWKFENEDPFMSNFNF